MTKSVKRRNPPWSYDELVLAMDLYVRRGIPGASDPDVIELSRLLNRLHVKQGTDAQPTLRNPNGVYLKLCNFRAKDQPGHGMVHGNHLEHDVWDRFANHKADLLVEVAAIRSRLTPPALDTQGAGQQVAGDRRAVLNELLKLVPRSGGQRQTTRTLMEVIREATELERLVEGQSEARAPDATNELRNSLTVHVDAILVLLAEFSHALDLGDSVGPTLTGSKATAEGSRPNAVHGGKLVIFPCGEPSSVRHFNRTVRRSVDLMDLGLNWEQLSEVLPTNYPFSQAHVWGVMPRSSGLNETRFKQCAAGDFALFTGGSKAFAAATIRAKVRWPELARALWHTDGSGRTWEFVFLLSEPIELQIPYEILNNALGYSSKFAFQAFSVLSDDATRHASRALDQQIGHLWP